MLNSRKGNLSCFQWEVERFQQSHRENMATVAPETYNRLTVVQQQLHRKAGGLRQRLAREQLAEVEVRKKNALLVERMTEIHRIGGFQRRCLREFQDVKAALQFGQTNLGVSRAAHERRFMRRKKTQELVRRENAKMITRLASPKRSGIDFNKYEADFAKSREHRRLVQCNRTVGHTSVLVTTKSRTPCSSADSTVDGQAPKKGHHREHARLVPQQRPLPVGQRSDSSPTLGGRKLLSSASNQTRNRAENNGRRAKESSDVAPCRPRAPVGCRRSTPIKRPHTALGLRRGSNHHDLFDARAADPGWGDGGNSLAHHRPPSAPERRREGADFAAVRPRRPLSSRFSSDDGGVLLAGTCRSTRPETGIRMGRRNKHSNDGEDDDDGNGEIVGSSGRGTPEQLQTEKVRLWCLGRTLLVEARVLVNGPKNDEKQATIQGRRRGGTRGGLWKVGLRFLSLDGLVRQRDGVQKTLRGFVVEASLAAARQTPSLSGGTVVGGNGNLGIGGSKIGSASVAVSAVQSYLDSTGHGAAGDSLKSFLEARPLDDRGNYRELNALLDPVGQRALCEILLASCRVITSGDRGGKVDVQLLRVNADGAGISATAAAPETRAHRSKPRDGAARYAGSVAREEIIGGSATCGEGAGSRVASERGGGKNSPIIVRMPAVTSGSATSPKPQSEDRWGSGGEEQEEEEEDDEEEDDEDEDGNR